MFGRSTAFCFCLVLVAFAPGQVRADSGGAGAESESLWVTSIARLGTSDEFVAATADGLLLREAAVYTFHAADPGERTKIYTHPAAVWCVVASNAGDRVASVDYRGNLVVFERASSQSKLYEKAFERWCQAMILSPDDQTVIAGNEAGKVMAWDLSGEHVTKSVELDGHAVTGLAMSPNGSQLAASDGGGHVHLLKWPELELLGKFDVGEDSTWCVAYVDEGTHLLVGSSDRQLYRCEAKPDAKPEVVAKGTDWITRLAVSPSGQIAAAEVGGRLHFPTTGGTDSMDAKSGVWALCWNGDGQLFAGTRKDGIVIAGRSWKWTEPKPAPAEPQAEPTAEQPEEGAKEGPAAEPNAAETESDQVSDDKPEAADAEAADADKPEKEQPAENIEKKE